jgi:hypothetical protein
MYSIDIIHGDDADFVGDFQVVFREVGHNPQDRSRIAHSLRQIADQLEDPEYEVRVAS